MNDIQQSIFNAIKNIINSVIKTLKYNYTIEGKITEVISSNIYNVNIKNNVYQIKTINSEVYNVGDLVLILILNNNFSRKVILGKNPF